MKNVKSNFEWLFRGNESITRELYIPLKIPINALSEEMVPRLMHMLIQLNNPLLAHSQHYNEATIQMPRA